MSAVLQCNKGRKDMSTDKNVDRIIQSTRLRMYMSSGSNNFIGGGSLTNRGLVSVVEITRKVARFAN